MGFSLREKLFHKLRDYYF